MSDLVIADRFGETRPKLQVWDEPGERRKSGLFVREVDYGPMAGRDRNKPCPCGSGRKWKCCHGRSS
jgi:uncharacterized protein YecA (UPF0149 family)